MEGVAGVGVDAEPSGSGASVFGAGDSLAFASFGGAGSTASCDDILEARECCSMFGG